MKKIAIATLNGYFNYGNRLQNFALQEVLKSLGFEVQTLKIDRNRRRSRFHALLRILKIWKNGPSHYYNIKYRQNEFIAFSNKYIKETERVFYLDDDLAHLNNEFDYFIVGSDQVWNPSMNRISSFYFLNFAEKHKRIAYAPSFGISRLPSEVVSCYQKWINGIPFLSVREDDGARIIKKITGREASVLVDPTLLLTKEKWLSVARQTKNKLNNNYLLTYFLGEIPSLYQKQITDIAKLKDLKIINLEQEKDKDTYRTGPCEFIDYINNCTLMCTDSFHGVVFSILMEKPFVVYKRLGAESMYSRIDTLMKKLDIIDREYDNITINNDLFVMDFSRSLVLLDEERKRSFSFLKNALNIIGVQKNEN